MHKNVEITIPFAENKEAHILLILKIFVSLREMSLEEARHEAEKFREGKDIRWFISEKNLKQVEGWMRSSGYFFKYVIM